MTESVVIVLLNKLAILLQEKVQFLKGIQTRVVYIKDELERMRAFLRVVDAREESDEEIKEPSAVSKLQNEVDSVLGDRFPTIEDMENLKYTTRVINESWRLYPQPPVLIRHSLENDKLGKYPIKSPNHWDDADKFNPERWPLDGPNPNETNQNFCFW